MCCGIMGHQSLIVARGAGPLGIYAGQNKQPADSKIFSRSLYVIDVEEARVELRHGD